MSKPLTRKSNIVVQELENEVLIYDLTINKAFCLNQTSGLVFGLCDGTRTVVEISDEMSKRHKTLVSEDLVYLALNELRENKLLENSDEVPDHFAGLSRREVVKKVGLASMVALPIIASVVAPSAVIAQSCNLALLPAGEITDNCATTAIHTAAWCETVGFPSFMISCVPGTYSVSPCVDNPGGGSSWTCQCCQG